MGNPKPPAGRKEAKEHQAEVLFKLLHVLAVLTVVFMATLAIAPAKAYFSDWRQIQSAYNERAAQAGLPEAEVRIRQIYRPDTKLTDRCVSCHLAMGGEKPLPEGGALFGAHPEVHHDVSTMGCTVCHSGQGRATSKDDAHGRVKHWEEPMLPPDHLQASCAPCHGDGAQVPPLAALDEGAYLFELHGCQTCHEGGRVGPDLSGVALKGYSRDWQERHLKDPSGTVEGSRMMRFGHLSDREVDVLVDYMQSLIGAPKLARGKAIAMELGCRGCHRIGEVGGDDGADISFAGDKSHVALDFTHVEGPHTAENWHREHLRNPQKVSPGSVMPAYVLPKQDEDALITYILSLREAPVPMELMPKHSVMAQLAERRDYPTDDGKALFGMFCSACHGADGEGQVMASLDTTVPGVTNLDRLSVSSPAQLRRTLAVGRPGRHMPAWGTKEAGLRESEVDALVDFVMGRLPEAPSWEAVSTAEADVSLGEKVYGHDCAGCHGIVGEGTVIAPSLINAEFLYVADDRFIYETLARGRDDTAMPSHSHYDAETMASVIAWIRSHEPAEDDWREPLDERVLDRLFVKKLEDYRAGGSPAHGAILFKQTCAGCHGERGQGAVAPAIGNRAFLEVASDGFIAASMLLGRGQRAMRAFDEQGLARTTEREVGDIIAYLRQVGSQQGIAPLELRVHAQASRGRQLYDDLCVGCHGIDGQGRTAPALNNQGLLDAVTDGFLQATIARGRRGTAMRGWAPGGYGFAELRPEQINDLVAFIRSWDVEAPQAPGGS